MRIFGRPVSLLWVLLALVITGSLYSINFFTNNYSSANEDFQLLKFEYQRTQAILQEEINRLKTRETDLETVINKINTQIKVEDILSGDVSKIINNQREDESEDNDEGRVSNEGGGKYVGDERAEPIDREDLGVPLNLPKNSNIKWAGTNPEDRRRIEVLQGIKPKVLIMSLPRSGSSFIGEIFFNNPDFVYLFEPTFTTMGNALWECQVSDPRMSAIATEIFQCDFSRFISSLVRHTKKKHFIYRDFSTPAPILKNYTKDCGDSMVAIKEVRRWGPNLKDLHIIFGSSLKVIWLMRDPRGWVSSFLYREGNKTLTVDEITPPSNFAPDVMMNERGARLNQNGEVQDPSDVSIQGPPNRFSGPAREPMVNTYIKNTQNNPTYNKMPRDSGQRTMYIPPLLREKEPDFDSPPSETEGENEEPLLFRETRDARPSPPGLMQTKRPSLSPVVPPPGQGSPNSIYSGTFYKVWGFERRNFWRTYYDCRNIKWPAHISEIITKKRSTLENQRVAAHLRMATVWLLETMINMHFTSQLPSDNVMLLRYEDFSLYPLDVVQQIYNFIGLPVVHADVLEWILEHTHTSVPKDRYGHDRDSAKMVSIWKDRLGLDVLRDIESITGELMEKFGYKRYQGKD
eukprot:TRINITY_DN2015_c0_g1_i2.p1 TRINITY_DN2015_c0_g1~~TRINITY_DN2015_c0_g1_i2.p1  ORF type:complete len:631 (-),score=83.19 TRINITY_DN2015_c0_g1_i2:76-1968(-)